MNWQKSEIEITSPKDLKDFRIGSLITTLATENSTHIWGYPDDEGIWLNNGRPGARFAPEVIRQYLYKMTPDSDSWKQIYDSGNLSFKNTLANRHKIAFENSKLSTKKNVNWISLGGGHDYGYSDAAGFVEGSSGANLKPTVINFDAHLDVRPAIDGIFNSGTPFNRLLTHPNLKFDFFEVGIQPQCNSPHHRQWAESYGATIIDYEDIRKSSLVDCLKKTISPAQKNSPLFLSLDIDCFSSQFAPGCSQSWATGLNIDEFLEAFDWLRSFFDFKALGIYEVSPPLDIQNQTSKLAALVCYHALKAFNGR